MQESEDDWIQIGITRGALQTLVCAVDSALDEERSIPLIEKYEAVLAHLKNIQNRPYADDVVAIARQRDN